MKHSIFLSQCFSEDSALWFPSRRQQEPQRWARRHRSSTCSGGGGKVVEKKSWKDPKPSCSKRADPKGQPLSLPRGFCPPIFVFWCCLLVGFFLSFLKWTASSSLSDSGRLGLFPVQKAYTRRRSVQICWADSSSCSRNISRAAFSFQNLAHTSRAQTSEILAIH